MKVVCLAPYLPYEQIPHAGGAFLHHYLAGLAARGDEVSLVVPSTRDNRAAATQDLPIGVDTHLVATPRSMEHTWMRTALYPYELLTAPSPGVLTRHAIRRSRTLHELVIAADIVELQWSAFLPLVNDVRRWRPDAPVSAFLHDLYGVSLGRMASHTESIRIRTAARLTYQAAGRRELSLVRRCDIAFSFNDRERQSIEDATGTPTSLVEPWIDWPASPHEPAESLHVLFVGDLRRHENHEGAAWLVGQVWPHVLAVEPSARLVLAGADPPGSIARLASDSVRVTGFVPSLAPYYDSTRVFVAPLRTGAGLKFKVAQALASGLPVVATTVAADGFAERGGDSVFGAITDEPSAFAEAILQFLQDRTRAIETGRAAAVWARSAFSFDRMIDRVRSTYLGTARSTP